MARTLRKVAATIEAIDTGPVEAEISAITIEAMAVSLQMPVDAEHPNRMPFSGILTRIDEASDSAPSGTNGKRVLITRAAAEGALKSLLGMGVGIKRGLDGHNPQNKVGLITAATLDGNAIHIEGFIYAADFPAEALRIHLRQADLGFSFEAQQLRVESVETDPVVVTSCIFTGAAILFKNDAAYKTTAIAAAAAKEYDMTEISDAVTAAVQAAFAPMTEQMTALRASQDAQNAAIEELKKGAPSPHAAVIAKIEPHAARLEAAAGQLEQDGVSGFHLRRVAAAMRADAAIGMMPRDLHDTVPNAVLQSAPLFKIEDAPEYKAIKAASDAQALELKATKDALDAQATVVKDMHASMLAQREPPARKTLTPEVNAVLHRMGLTEPGEGGGGIPMHKVDAAMDQMKDTLSTTDRIRFKTMLARDGVIQAS